MKKYRIRFKRFLKNLLSKDVFPLEDNGTSIELHCYKLFGTYVKITKFLKSLEANDEQCEYLGII